ncbi:MAG TPA: permease [Candidatus Limnocylindrales bacterium]|jgi:uncharacterized membrane protein YraQ (UPF0718 family)|nr:permease [Candidatus Limnocylindrales bacterium]
MEAVVIVGSLVVLLTIVAAVQGGPGRAVEGYRTAASLALSVLPQVSLGFVLAGLIAVVVPSDLIGAWIGEESGLRGVIVATLAGMLTPGGPFLQFPLVASLARGGAGVGPIAAYLTAWSLLGLNRAIVWELPLLGGTFALARYTVSILAPILVGLSMPVLVRLLSR